MRTLSNTVKTSSIEGKNWKQDIEQFLLQYRATPHSITGPTGKSPAELLFGRPIKTKLPNVPPTVPGDEKVRMKDRLAKSKMKTYADGRNNRKASTIQVGDMVLVRQKRKNKLSSRYHPEPVSIIQRKGSMVTVEKPDGSTLTRNIPHVKKISKEETVGETFLKKARRKITKTSQKTTLMCRMKVLNSRCRSDDLRERDSLRALLETMLYIELRLILYFILEVHIRVILSKEKEGCSVLMLC